MPEAHLLQLRSALTRRGWKLTELSRGEENTIGAATWQVQRRFDDAPLFIDFDGFGGLGEDIPLEESAGCQLRGCNIHLYFSRMHHGRERWKKDLKSFISSMDTAVSES